MNNIGPRGEHVAPEVANRPPRDPEGAPRGPPKAPKRHSRGPKAACWRSRGSPWGGGLEISVR
eukprot:8050972-Pyramimonas_sp.AAC.1